MFFTASGLTAEMAMQLIQCASEAGVTSDTLRHYLRAGLVRPEGRTPSGYRTFSKRTVARVRFIRAAVGLGFTLGDIQELLRMSDQVDLPCPQARRMLAERIDQQRERLDAMTALYQRMKRALREWRQMPDGVPDGNVVCGLIEGTAQRMPPDPKTTSAARGF